MEIQSGIKTFGRDLEMGKEEEEEEGNEENCTAPKNGQCSRWSCIPIAFDALKSSLRSAVLDADPFPLKDGTSCWKEKKGWEGGELAERKINFVHGTGEDPWSET